MVRVRGSFMFGSRVVVTSALVMLVACGGGGKVGMDASSGSDGAMHQGDGSTQQGDGGSGGVTCTTGTLFAGDPVYVGNPSDRPTSGTGILADPPLLWQTLLFADTHLYTREEAEIWGVDLLSGSPVETKITGTTPAGSSYPYNANNVPCGMATFTHILGLGALGDGSLVFSDSYAGAVIKIANPNNVSTCTVSVLAGNATASAGIDPSVTSTLPAYAVTDGAGTAARFNAVGALVVDSQDNVYVVDNTATDGQGKALLRKIDSAGNVTTVLTMPNNNPPTGPETIENLVTVGTTLYAASRNAINQGFVIKIDPVAKSLSTVAGGGGSTWAPVDSAADPETSGIATDGQGFYVAGAGYVWYVTLAGQITLVAGTGVNIDNFPSGYDAKASHPALELALPTRIGPADEFGASAIAQIAYHGGAVYYRGFADGTSDFIERITCK